MSRVQDDFSIFSKSLRSGRTRKTWYVEFIFQYGLILLRARIEFILKIIFTPS